MRTLSKQLYLLGIAFLFSNAFNTVCHAEIIHNESAIEAVKFQYNLIGKDSGNIIAQQCEKCTSVRINITPETKAYTNGKFVPLTSVPRVSKIAITIIYDAKTMKAHKLIW